MENELKELNKQIRKNKLIYFFHGPKKLIMKYYKKEQGYSYEFNKPMLFTEKINTRKAEKNKLMTLCADKIRVREYVKEKIGEEYLIPTYFIAKKLTGKLYDRMPNACVLKTASGSGTIKIILDKEKENKRKIIKLMKEFQKVKYEYVWGEMFYKGIKNDIICEKLLLKKDKRVPDDIKIHCFNNGGDKKFFIQIEVDRFQNHRRNIYDENFNLLDITTGLEKYEGTIEKPKNWEKMIQIATKLSEDFSYVRVDLYNFEGKIYFGELTFTHNAGFTKFSNQEYNVLWGEYWK